MDAKKAVEKIEEINTILQASNRVLLSGKIWIVWGLIWLSVLPIGYFTQWLTFGHDFGPYQIAYISIANTIFYWSLAVGIIKLVSSKRSEKYQASLHPLIRKAFSISLPASVSIAGIVLVFALTGQWKFISPMVLIILGMMFWTFGKFSVPAVSYFAWSYIGAGLLFLYLRSFEIPSLDLYFWAFYVLTTLSMGFFMMRMEKTHA